MGPLHDWDRIRELFEQLIDATPAEREARLAELQGDPAAEQVRKLFASASEPFFLEEPLTLALRMRALGGLSAIYAPGTTIADRFEIRSLLGSGGMGDVYRAFDRMLGGEVALKTIRTAYRVEPKYHEYLMREVQAARRVTHANVCRVYDVGLHEGVPFLTMELLEGESLSAVLARRGALTFAEAVVIVGQIASGLAAAHAAEVVHRDLKPGNVILASSGSSLRAVVTDFGLAQMHDTIFRDVSSLKTGILVGTPDYLAPEVLAGDHATPASDIFALGCIIFEIITGRRPFSTGVRGVVERVTGRVATPDCIDTLPRRWARSIARCLEPDPQRRPKSAAEVAAMLHSGWSFALPRISRRVWIGLSTSAGAGALLALWPRQLSGFKPLAAGATILVADVQNATTESRLASVSDLIRSQLMQSDHVNVMDRLSIGRIRERMGRDPATVPDADEIREIAARAGAALVVFSSISPLGRAYVFNVQLESFRHGPTPSGSARQSYTVERSGELFEVVRQASDWIREAAGESHTHIAKSSRPPQDLTTSSWEALEEFSGAAQLSLENRHEDAILLLRSAVRRDPAFASAWARIGDLSNTLRREADAIESWKRALEAMSSRKLARREELRILGMFAYDTGAIDESDKHFRTWSIEFPADPLGKFYRTVPLAYAGRGEEALENLAGVEPLMPPGTVIPNNRALVSLVLNRPDAAIASLDSVAGAPDRRAIRASLRAGALLQKLNPGAAREALRSARGEAGLAAYYFECVLLAETGKFEAAATVAQDGLAQPGRTDDEPARADLQVFAAALNLRLGRTATARQTAYAILDNGAGALRSAHAAITLIRSGNTAAAKPVLNRLAKHSDVFYHRFATNRILGALALRDRDVGAALKHFEAASALQPRLWYRDYLGEARSRRAARNRRC